MNASSVLRQIGLTSALTGALAFACVLFARVMGDAASARGLLMTGIFGLFIGGALLVALRDAPSKTGAREGLLFVILFWIVTPFIAAPPFISSGVADGWIQAFFESTSNLTTTGATSGNGIQPDAIRLWRAMLQFIGGVTGVIISVVVLAALNLTGPGIHRSHLLTLPKDDLFGRIERIALTIGIVYGVAFLVGTFGLVLSGAGLLDSVTRTIAAVTTSTTLSDTGGVFDYSNSSIIIISFLLFFGATNVAIHSDILRRGGWRMYYKDGEGFALLAAVIILTIGIWLVIQSVDFRYFAEALSFVSTSGMNITGVNGVTKVLPQPIPDIIAFVGGSALSTAGGLKISRVTVLMSRADAEFRRLSFANSKATLRFQGQSRKDNIVVGVWVYLIAYISATVFLGMLLALAGLSIEECFRTAIGAISNTGTLVDTAVLDQAPSNLTLFLLSVGCILGRVEVLALAPLFTLDFWRR